jgi:hypothetical protein
MSAQLDAGVRFVELDVHDNEFAAYGFRVGHDAPGDEVEHGGGNPASDALGQWLGVIASWSDGHPGHAPITLGIDIKDPLTDNASYAAGNLARLNAELEQAFGAKLFAARDLTAGFPGVNALRDRVIAVLSGDEGTRMGYRRDRGADPAIALDAAGRVVEVHDSGGGELWYWTGEIIADGSVVWHGHGRYDTGQKPAIALGADGVVVGVHEDPDLADDQLWYRVGRLGADFEIDWASAQGLPFPGNDEGAIPSVAFVGDSALREVHQSQSSSQHWYWNGALDAAALTITWSRNSGDGGQTSDPLFDESSDSAGGKTVSVSVGSFGPWGADTLLAATDGGPQPIRYRQLMFVEAQYGGAAALEADSPWFFAASAFSGAGSSWALGWRASGKLVRLWQFDTAHVDAAPPPSFPATDHPAASWYDDYCNTVGCIAP